MNDSGMTSSFKEKDGSTIHSTNDHMEGLKMKPTEPFKGDVHLIFRQAGNELVPS
jgi:hypothetical protein